MNAYEELETAILRLAAESPGARLELRSLRGTRDLGDALIVERQVGREVRLVRFWATSEPVVSFYWGFLPAPGEPMAAEHSEGHRYGNLDYQLFFARALLLRLEHWRKIPLMKSDGSAPDQEADQ